MMADEITGMTPTTPETTTDTPANGKTSIDSLPADVQAYIRSLREENKTYRQTNDAILKAQQEAENKKLAENNEWRTLYEKAQQELEALKPTQQQAEQYKSALEGTLAKRLESLPVEYKSLVPEFGDPVKTIAWLDANATLFAARRAPNLDAGVQGTTDGKGSPKLSAEETSMAAALGITLEKYAARKQEIAAQRRQGEPSDKD
jgi:hypothetical protein